MKERQVGVVHQLFRYPVKSMAGESLSQLEIGEKGVIGDRRWAVREANGRIATAKKWANLLDFRASYAEQPRTDAPGLARIRLPDGSSVQSSEPGVSEKLSAVLGRSVRLEQSRPDEWARGEIDTKTIFGDVGVERVMPQFTAATMPDSFGLYRGTFFDSATIHIITTGSMAHLQSLIDEDAQIDARRFRPNIVVETEACDGFIEDEWLDGELQIGAHLRIVSMQQALRCVMTTHRQSDLPRDLRVLRAVAQNHNAKLGVFAAVGAPGMISIGDPVWLSHP
jgi:MOSC domain-containing protein